MNAAAGRLARRDTDGNAAGELAPTTTSDRLSAADVGAKAQYKSNRGHRVRGAAPTLKSSRASRAHCDRLKARLMLGHAPRACRAKAIRLVCKGLGTHVVKG